jgi:hypothetical protein
MKEDILRSLYEGDDKFLEWYEKHSVSKKSWTEGAKGEIATPAAFVTDLLHVSINTTAFCAASLFNAGQDLSYKGGAYLLGESAVAFKMFKEVNKNLDTKFKDKADAALKRMRGLSESIKTLQENLKIPSHELLEEGDPQPLTEEQYKNIQSAFNDPSIIKLKKAEAEFLNALFEKNGSNYVLKKSLTENDRNSISIKVDSIERGLGDASTKLNEFFMKLETGKSRKGPDSSLSMLDNIKILFAEDKWKGLKETAKYALIKLVVNIFGLAIAVLGALAVTGAVISARLINGASRAANLIVGVVTMTMSCLYCGIGCTLFAAQAFNGEINTEAMGQINDNVHQLWNKGVEMIEKSGVLPKHVTELWKYQISEAPTAPTL